MPSKPQTHRPAGAAAAHLAADHQRPSAHRRGYGKDWQATRATYLRLNPLCADCLEADPPRYTPAVDVHHRSKLADHPGLKHDFDNLMGLCKRCHARRTARGE